MKFQKILILESKKKTANHKRIKKNLKEILRGASTVWKNKKSLNQKDIDSSDLLISLGGDGTFLFLAGLNKNKPIIGINSDKKTSEGKLCALNFFSVSKLKKIMSGDYKEAKANRISVKVNGRKIKTLALNEVFFGSAVPFHTSRYKIIFKNKTEEQISSGVIVTTGIGSTAWYKSAGGKPFDKNSENLKFIVREPYFGKIYSPKIIKGKISPGKSLRIISKMAHESVVALDSINTVAIKKGQTIEISSCREKLKMLKPKK